MDVTSEIEQGEDTLAIAETPVVSQSSGIETSERRDIHLDPKLAPLNFAPSFATADFEETEELGAHSESSPQDTPRDNSAVSLTSATYAESSNWSATLSSQGLSRIYFDPPVWPLENVEEATLLQHFISVVSLFVSTLMCPLYNKPH